VSAESGSRAATNQLLAELRDGRWRPSAWTRFLADATRRSARQARQHPRALAEITALHTGFAVLARRGRVWTVVSWALAATHLGMLDGRRSIGWANAITLTRANLPTLAGGWWLPVLALGSDVADGRLARGLGTASPFGASADALADAAFWAWYALRHEPSRPVRAVALLAWVAPVLTVTTISVSSGHMVDSPRPALLRPAAALQAALTIRAILRRLNRCSTALNKASFRSQTSLCPAHS
jgi:phosphatidylglycerophosphate synthase